jgi:hypothetical protein
VPYVIGARDAIVVALDWTDFDADKQATIMLSLITDHGRATPLVWLTVDKRTLKNNRSRYEHRGLVRLAELLPADIKVCVVADRGFGDQKLYEMHAHRRAVLRLCDPLPRQHRRHRPHWRSPHCCRLGAARRTCARAARRRSHRRSLCCGNRGLRAGPGHEAGVVPGRQQHQRHREASHRILRRLWGIECGPRDTKDLRFGMGMGAMHVKSPERRDRLWLLNTFAVVLLTSLGAAGEALGYDRMLKTNTARRRVHSLFRQGCMLYDLIPTMPETRLRPLMQCFSRMLQDQPLFADVFRPV